MLQAVTIIVAWLTIGGVITFILMLANTNSDPEAVSELPPTPEKSAARIALEILQMFIMWPVALHVMIKAYRNKVTPLEQIVLDKKNQSKKVIAQSVPGNKQSKKSDSLPPIDKPALMDMMKTSGFQSRFIETKWLFIPMKNTVGFLRVSLYAISKEGKELLFPVITHYLVPDLDLGKVIIYRGVPKGPNHKLGEASSLEEAQEICCKDIAWHELCTPEWLSRTPAKLADYLMRTL